MCDKNWKRFPWTEKVMIGSYAAALHIMLFSIFVRQEIPVGPFD